MFRDKCERPLLQPKLGAFLYAHFGPFGGAAEGDEGRNFGIERQAVIAPVAGGDHPSVKVEDPLELDPVESGNGTPVPRMRKRRDDAQALFTFGAG